MLGAIFLIVVLFGLSQPLLAEIERKHPYLKAGLLNQLFWYHMFFGLVYYTYALFNRSDSWQYFENTKAKFLGWWDYFSEGTRFMEWLAFPLIRGLSFNFEMTMFFFTWIGFWGFVFFYLFFKENLNFNLKFNGWDALTISLFLPNMHFWTASFGKGAAIFCGIGMLVYGLSRPGKRLLLIALGGFLVYMIRPHILFAILIGMGVGYVLGREKIPLYQKYLTALAGIVFSILFYENILGFLKIDPDNFFESFDNRSIAISRELRSSGSGVDMSSYSLPMKLFTFWFRPLFVDAPNVLGIIVSFENLIYIFLFTRIINRDFISYIKEAPAMVKMSGIVFISISISMTYVMSNLGIIIRQKSQIMYFMIFVVLAFLDWQKTQRLKKRMEIYNRIVEEEERRRGNAVREV